MANAKPDDAVLLEEKLAHALASRGLATRDEFQLARSPNSPGDLEAILGRLVKANRLTTSQVKRLIQELPSLAQQQIPGYHLLEKLGQGSMGTVFKARQLSMDRLVAIKVLSPKLAADAKFLERFQREARLAAKFSSNNVVQAIDVGSAGNLNYFVMEYVEGTTLKEFIDQGRKFEEKEAVDIILQAAQALAHAHRRNLIHRDIKPANILITKEGIAKLADLGMARATDDEAVVKAERNLIMGTPYYISPEQIRRQGDVDSRSDIYSLGATFYHILTGKPPFQHAKVEQILKAHLEEELVPPDHINTKLSSGVGETIEFMMAKKRANRYPSPDELIADLERLLHGEAPKFARQRTAADSLKGLDEGEEIEDEERPRKRRPKGVPLAWAYALGGALSVSLLANLFLAVKR